MLMTIIKTTIWMLRWCGNLKWKSIFVILCLASWRIWLPWKIRIYANNHSVQTIMTLHHRLTEYLIIHISDMNHLPVMSSCKGDITGIRSRTIWPICFQNFTIVLVRWRVFDKIFESFTFAFCVLIWCFLIDNSGIRNRGEMSGK